MPLLEFSDADDFARRFYAATVYTSENPSRYPAWEKVPEEARAHLTATCVQVFRDAEADATTRTIRPGTSGRSSYVRYVGLTGEQDQALKRVSETTRQSVQSLVRKALADILTAHGM